MTGNIHTVMVTYNRFELTHQALLSWMETTTGQASITVVDNNSSDGTQEWVREFWYPERGDRDWGFLFLPDNKYPGYATNRGWEMAPEGTVLLHRADNDFVFLPGWEDHVRLQFSANPRLGQLGLRTDEEELHNTHNVGGNNVIRRELWDEGLRYDERSWPEITRKVPGYTEDSFFTPAVKKLGWEWGRVSRPCVRPISREEPGDSYYEKTWADRGIKR